MLLNKYRNIGIVAHIDAGKTTVTERILYFTGNIRKIGEVHDGKATMDFMKQEQERGITISSAAITCLWNDHQINIIDTPGHVDFMLEVERSLRVLDGVVSVFCAVNGVEPQTETVWNQAQKYKVPRLAFINKMDQEGADFDLCVSTMNDRLEANAVAFQIPYFKDGTFAGMIDLVEEKTVVYDDFKMKEVEIPGELKEKVSKYRNLLIEKVAEFDDEMIELYLNNKEISKELIKKTARYGVINSLITPVFCGAAYKNIGVQKLLDAVCDYLPSPLDKGSVTGYDLEDAQKNHTRIPSSKEKFSALAFKIIYDPYVGQQTFIRIYSGSLKHQDIILNSTRNKEEKISRILQIHAQERKDIDVAQAGDIVAVTGLKQTTTGDTLCSVDHALLLEKIFIPQTVLSVKAIVGSQQEKEKLTASLSKLNKEDPSFNFNVDDETNEIIVSGMGELHLEIILDRLKTEFGVIAQAGEPSISYRETITKEVTVDKRYVKQSGGKGHFAHCILRIEPNQDKGFEFIDKVKGGNIPKEYIPAVKKGIEDAMQEGPYAGYPVVDIRCVLLDGTAHIVDSSEMAFRLAGSMAVKKGINKAHPVLLEPMMKMEINTPDEYLGDVLGDLSRRRGKVNNLRRFRKGSQKINAVVPLKEMFGYATSLRTISSGRATFSMELYNYSQLNEEMAKEIVKDRKERKKE